jgi:uncharacterized cupredoxin-like copper-binding protein
MKKFLFVSALALSAISVAAFADGMHAGAHDHSTGLGKAGDPAQVTRTVTVDMSDAMRFTPQTITVEHGETVRFIVSNSGVLKHEMVLGSMQELKQHAELMRKMPEMEHAEENMVTVDPGKSGEIVWQFAKAGKVDFACLQPGHFEAGMKGRVAVR